MKTTLKRGIGRGAEVNGNGRAVYPPAIQPPMRRYRQPEPAPRSAAALIGKVLLWVLVAALMVVGGVAGGTYLYVDRDVAQALQGHSEEVKVAQEQLDAAIPGEPTTALLLGYDRRAGEEAELTGNSDTLMLVRADPEHGTVSLLSFPRDLVADIVCPNEPTVRDRINSAYPRCGAEGSLLTVRQLTGLPINYLITVDFRGFKQIVSHLGGVWIDVDRRYFNDNSGFGERYATIDLQPGYQKLNGSDSLDFVRYRHSDSDLYRVARQQQFVKAVKQRLEAFSAFDLQKLVNIVTKNVEVGHIGEFNARTVLGYALFAYDLPAGNVFQTKMDPECFEGYAELTVATSCVQMAIADFLEPDVEAADRATAAALGRAPRNAAPPADETTVAVLNGNGHAGAAATAGNQLDALGYQIVSGSDGNAPSWEYFRTEVYYDQRQGSEPAAQRIAKLFGDARVAPLPAEIKPLSSDALVTVIVGQTYNGTIDTSGVDRTPKRQPPQVKQDSSAAPLLQDAAGRVPYALYVPTVIEQSSRLDATTPMRVYKLGDHNAVRLTYGNGTGDFWGIQMTSWKDAPALQAPNETETIGGRTYRLYYNGPKLHMVVLETEEATFWVVNTVLDRLSNETMLEIAKGLRPLQQG